MATSAHIIAQGCSFPLTGDPCCSFKQLIIACAAAGHPQPAPPRTRHSQCSKGWCFGTEGQTEEGGTSPGWIPAWAPTSGDTHQALEPARSFPGPSPAHSRLHAQGGAVGRAHPVFGEARGMSREPPCRPRQRGTAPQPPAGRARSHPPAPDQPLGRAQVLRSPDPVVSCNNICD